MSETRESRKGLFKLLAVPWILLVVVCLLWGQLQSWLGIGPETAMIGQVAPGFALPIVAGDGAAEGDRVRLADLRGKPVILDFWASWCPPCRRSMPLLDRLYRQHQSAGLHLVGINVEPDLMPQQIAHVERSFGARFPSVQDADGAIQRAYGVVSLPTTVILDRDGKVVDVHVGVPDMDELNQQIRSLLR